MARANKTKTTEANVYDFIESFVDNEQKKADSLQLIKLMSRWSGHEPKMYGPSIIGFGNYHYVYASGHEGDAPLLGFSPRKTAISLYITSTDKDYQALLDTLGTFSMGKACIYIKKLSDINLTSMEKICKATLEHMRKKYSST